MNRTLPSTRSLQVFAAAARHGSLQKAALELYLTPSALSKQVQALEELLGFRLFERGNRKLTLTDAGVRYAEVVQRLLTELADTAIELGPAPTATGLRVLTPSGFSSLYLASKLSAFGTRHPEVSLTLESFPGKSIPDFAEMRADAAIVMYDGQRNDAVEVVNFFRDPYLIPVAAPALLPHGKPLRDPQQIAGYTWLKHQHQPGLWDYWLRAAGVPGVQAASILWFDSAPAIMEAAAGGSGIGMGGGAANHPLAYVTQGRLIPAYDFQALSHPWSYYLVMPRASVRRPVVQAFSRWLVQAFS